jgi:hypothetical protein
MEGTDATIVPASRQGNLHMHQGNRLHVRVAVHGNELELTDERADNKPASINVQELISAFTGVLKATANTTPVTTQYIAGNHENSGIRTESQEFKAEIMQIQQRVQKFESEITHLQQLLQKSKKENEDLRVRFRAATHMKAAELAQQLAKINTVHNATDAHGPQIIPSLVEPFTPEQKPTEFILNSKVKEIDFLSLDDVLGKDDAIFVPSAEEMSKKEDKVIITNNSRSVPGTVSIF